MMESTGYPSSVYKYVTPDRIDILQDLAIRFTQPSALNDPFELKPIFSQMVSDEELEQVFDVSSHSFKKQWRASVGRLYSGQSRLFKRRVSLKQFYEKMAVHENYQAIKESLLPLKPSAVSLNKSHASSIKEMLIEKLSKVGILSFSATAKSATLWAHYAQNSKGLAYEFDSKHSFFNRRRSHDDILLHLRAVNYKDRAASNLALATLSADDVYYTKASSWMYEEEWRIVAPLAQAETKLTLNNEEIYLFEIPALAIRRVIFGANASNDLVAKIKSTIHNREGLSHIEMAQIHVNFESHCLDVVPLSQNFA